VWWLRCRGGCGPHIAKTHTPRERNQKRSKRTTQEARKNKRTTQEAPKNKCTSRCAYLSGHPPVCALVFQPTAFTETKLTASVSWLRTEQIFASPSLALAQLRLVTRECCRTALSIRNGRKYETDASKNSFEIESA